MSHQTISFAKSAIRLVGYALLTWDLLLAATVLCISEGLGIYEEIGH